MHIMMRAISLLTALLLLLLNRAAFAHDDVRLTLARLEELARATPSDLALRLRHAELSRLAGDPDAARRDLDTLESHAPRMPAAFLLRAALAGDAGRPAEVVVQVGRFLAVSDSVDDATVGRAFALRARAHAELHETAMAIDDWDRALALAPAPPPTGHLPVRDWRSRTASLRCRRWSAHSPACRKNRRSSSSPPISRRTRAGSMLPSRASTDSPRTARSPPRSSPDPATCSRAPAARSTPRPAGPKRSPASSATRAQARPSWRPCARD
jgi:hypothetical protein